MDARLSVVHSAALRSAMAQQKETLWKGRSPVECAGCAECAKESTAGLCQVARGRMRVRAGESHGETARGEIPPSRDPLNAATSPRDGSCSLLVQTL